MPFTQPGTRFRLTETIGSEGIAHFGRRSRVEDEWHPNLRGYTAVKVYREMRDNDSIIGGAANIIEQMLRQVRWKTSPASQTPNAIAAQKFVDGCIKDMDHTWADFMSDVVSMLWYGWASFEKVYKVRNGKNSRFDDNRIGFKGIYIRGQDTLREWQWDPDNNDDVIDWWQQSWMSYQRPVFLPMEKMVHFRVTANRGNPEGRSLLRNAYRSWFIMKRLQEVEGIGFERNLEGIPVIRLPLSLYEDTKSGKRGPFDRMVQLIRRNEHQGMTFPAAMDREGKPTGYDIQILTSGAAAQVLTAIREAIRGYQREIGINFNTQFQQLGTDGVGSNALSSDQTNMFAVGLGSLLMNVKDTLNRGPIDEVQELNGIAQEDRAILEHSDIEKPDLDKFAKAMTALASVDLLRPDDGVRAVVRDLFTLPKEEQSIPDDAQEEADEDDALVMADELIQEDDDTSEPIPTQKDAVPHEVMEAAQRFLMTWQTMAKSKRTKSVVMLGRARMLARGRMKPANVEAMTKFFQATKRPGKDQQGSTPWQYWEANGGDAARTWLLGR